jgi:hypothetical protein
MVALASRAVPEARDGILYHFPACLLICGSATAQVREPFRSLLASMPLAVITNEKVRCAVG